MPITRQSSAWLSLKPLLQDRCGKVEWCPCTLFNVLWPQQWNNAYSTPTPMDTTPKWWQNYMGCMLIIPSPKSWQMTRAMRKVVKWTLLPALPLLCKQPSLTKQPHLCTSAPGAHLQSESLLPCQNTIGGHVGPRQNKALLGCLPAHCHQEVNFYSCLLALHDHLLWHPNSITRCWPIVVSRIRYHILDKGTILASSYIVAF